MFYLNHKGIDDAILKGVFAKNERGYRLNAIKKALLIATNLTSICCSIIGENCLIPNNLAALQMEKIAK